MGAGTSCDTDAEVSGHFYAGSLDSDPWSDIVFVADGTNADGVIAAVEFGETYSDSSNRAFVIHASNGDRVTCAIISDSSWDIDIDSEALATAFLILIIVLIAVPVICICIIVLCCCGVTICCCAANSN